MQELFTSGRAVDVVLLAMAVEVAALAWLRLRRGRGLAPLDLAGQLAAGLFLALAVRAALTGADYRLTAALLAAAFPAHLFDLARRLRASRAAGKQ